MRIYISLPITDKDENVQREKAKEAVRAIKALGHEAKNPFDVMPPEWLVGKKAYAYYMGRDIEQLLNCDAVLLLDDWEKSKGCRLEQHAAMIYGLRVYDSVSQIEREN